MRTEEALRSSTSMPVGHSQERLSAVIPPSVDLARDAFKAGPPGAVLQAPVDDGRATCHMAEDGTTIVGVGATPEAVNMAGDTVARAGHRDCILMTANLDALPFPDDHFAGVLSVDHLGHLREPVPALKELLRVCRPGGHVVVDVFAPGDSARHSGLEPDRDGGYVDSSGTFYRFFDKWWLESVLSAAGILGGSQIEKMSWEKDPDVAPHNVLNRRQSWIVVARKDARGGRVPFERSLAPSRQRRRGSRPISS